MITADKTYSKETIQLYQTQDTPAKAAQNSQQNRIKKGPIKSLAVTAHPQSTSNQFPQASLAAHPH